MNTNIFLFELARFLLNNLLRPFISFLFSIFYAKINKSNRLPPIKNELLLLPASVLASKIRRKEVNLRNSFFGIFLLKILIFHFFK